MYLETWDVCWAKAGHAQFMQPTLPIPEFYKLQITCSHIPYHHHHYNHCKYLHLQVFVILVLHSGTHSLNVLSYLMVMTTQ